MNKTQTLILTVALMRLEIIGVILSNFFSKASYLDSVIEKDTVHGFSDHIHTTKWEREIRQSSTDAGMR